MVAGHGLGLVAAVLLLVQDQKTQVRQGRENGAPGPQDHPRPPLPQAFPLVVALTEPKGAVKHHHFTAEVSGEAPHHAGGQDDLRHQHHGAPAPVQAGLDQLEIDLRLAAAGDALQQGGGGLPGVQVGQQVVIGPPLLLVQGDGRRRGQVRGLRHPEDLLLRQADEARLGQGLHRPGGRPGLVAELVEGGLPRRQEEAQDRRPPRGLPLPALGLGLRLLGGAVQLRQAVGLVLEAALGPGLHREDALFSQGRRRGVHPLPQLTLELGEVDSAAPGRQGPDQLRPQRGLPRFLDGLRLVQSLRQGAALRPAEPKPRRQDGPDGLEHGAVAALAQEGCQRDAVLRQDRTLVQHGGDGLAAPGGLPLHHQQHHGLR